MAGTALKKADAEGILDGLRGVEEGRDQLAEIEDAAAADAKDAIGVMLLGDAERGIEIRDGGLGGGAALLDGHGDAFGCEGGLHTSRRGKHGPGDEDVQVTGAKLRQTGNAVGERSGADDEAPGVMQDKGAVRWAG